MNEELKNNALNDDDLEQVTGGKRTMKKVRNGRGYLITATAADKAAAVAEGRANIAEAAAVAYANEN